MTPVITPQKMTTEHHTANNGYGSVVKQIFVDSNALRENLLHFHTEARAVQEVAMNAAVAAGQTGSHARVFTEIATQIERTARKILAATDRARVQTDAAATASLRAVRAMTFLNKYISVERTITGANRILLDAPMSTLSRQVANDLSAVLSRLNRCEAALRTMRQLHYRLFGALSSIQVEAIQLSCSELATIESLAESLSVIQERIHLRLGNIFQLIEAAREHLVSSGHQKGFYLETSKAI